MEKRREHKRGRMRGGRGILGLAFGFGLAVVLEEVFEREEGSIIHLGHTTSGWTWAPRAREPVEVSWAGNYFLVGWEVNPISSQEENSSRSNNSRASPPGYWYRYFSMHRLLM